MTTKNIKISDSAKEELRAAKITGNRLDLAGQVKNYAELKKLFQNIGVIWNKKDKTHYLENGAQETIDFILNGGQIIDKKKTLQAFYTPASLAARAVELAEVSGMTVLEPSCGEGALVKECFAQGANSIFAIDINDAVGFDLALITNWCVENERQLIYQITDFLTYPPDKVFDRIVMNPPYDKNTWVKHLQYAWNFLESGGRLVAICPNNDQNKQFQKFISDKVYEIHPVEAGTFKESGTNIATMILVIHK
jgi:16S rRNA G966 N2-methylase RsmD